MHTRAHTDRDINTHWANIHCRSRSFLAGIPGSVRLVHMWSSSWSAHLHVHLPFGSNKTPARNISFFACVIALSPIVFLFHTCLQSGSCTDSTHSAVVLYSFSHTHTHILCARSFFFFFFFGEHCCCLWADLHRHWIILTCTLSVYIHNLKIPYHLYL